MNKTIATVDAPLMIDLVDFIRLALKVVYTVFCLLFELIGRIPQKFHKNFMKFLIFSPYFNDCKPVNPAKPCC